MWGGDPDQYEKKNEKKNPKEEEKNALGLGVQSTQRGTWNTANKGSGKSASPGKVVPATW